MRSRYRGEAGESRGRRTAVSWDRGQDVPAADETAQAIVDFLCAGLAEWVCGQ